MEQVKRIASALVILPPLVLFLWYASPGLFLILVLALIGLSLYEYFHILQHIQLSLCTSVTFLAACALAITAYLGGWRWLPLVLFLSMVALTISVMCIPSREESPPSPLLQRGVSEESPPSPLLQRGVRGDFPTLVYSIFGVLFIGWNLSHLILLRLLPAGQSYILFLCAVVWVGDSAAMYVGKSLGRSKMAPAISPGKTWEGSVGGAVGGVLTAVWSAGLWLPHLVLWQCVMLGLCISVAAQMSDLGESMLKRYAGVKDSGGLIPGHGGILDRVDSLLFAAPTLVYALHVLMPVPSP